MQMMIMKRIKELTILMLGLMLSFGMTSCGGDDEGGNDNGGNTSSKRIVKMVEEDGDYVSTFAYDSKGRVVRVVQTEYYSQGSSVSELSYQYSEMQIVSNEEDGSWSCTHTYTLSNGLIVKDVEEQFNNGRRVDKMTTNYTYDSDGYMTSLTRKGDGYSDTLDLVWTDGNLMSLARHSYSYSNIPWCKGMFFYFKGGGMDPYLWPAGFWGKSPKNMPSKDSVNDVIYEYSLSSGLIVEKRIIEGSYVSISSYVWE